MSKLNQEDGDSINTLLAHICGRKTLARASDPPKNLGSFPLVVFSPGTARTRRRKLLNNSSATAQREGKRYVTSRGLGFMTYGHTVVRSCSHEQQHVMVVVACGFQRRRMSEREEVTERDEENRSERE